MNEKDLQRFWSKVGLPDENGCLSWRASATPKGYGCFYLDGRLWSAHRVAWLIAYGELPPAGLLLDHRHCQGNTLCVNVEHLVPVTSQDNIRRSRLSKRSKSGLKGVDFYQARGRWRASIYIDKRSTHLGYFDDPIDAARAYDVAALEHFGDAALTNAELGLVA